MYQLIVFLPLIGAIIAGFGGSKVFKMMGTSIEGHGHGGDAHAAHDHGEHGHHGDAMWPQYLTTGFLFVSMILSWVAFAGFLHEGHPEKVEVLRWIQSGALSANWTLRIDTLTVVMLVVVTTVSALVHLYSIGYMGHDEHQSRFFAYLSLFTFAMLMLVTADNLLQLFFGWEGVGLCSYLLIGFWYKRPSANAAAIKAFIVNRVGDFGFALGIFGVFAVFGTISFDQIFAAIPEAPKTIHFLSWQVDTMTALCLLLFMGAMGKSAQFLLHTWLPDAMEGPTPVSALIHAATMVTAGVFMVARLSPIFEAAPAAKEVVILVGAVTAFFAATVGLVQNDIKRIVAYSTCSQLGYMFVAMGAGAYGVGMFHLFTHAFFKALLFLGSGSVIHAMGGEQDIRKMGGLAPKIRVTWAMMLVGTLALTGFPLTAGYFSKDAIIESAFAAETGMGMFAFTLLVAAALCTSFYSWRLMFLTFHGESRADRHALEHAHESPNTMLVPLYVLALGAVAAGFVFKEYFIGHDYSHFWAGSVSLNKVIEEMHHLPGWVPWAPTAVMAIGLAIAWLFYIRDTSLPERLAQMHMPLYKFLLNKWYFDELYDFIFVRPAMWIGRFFWKKGDGYVIDGFGPDGISARVLDVTRGAIRLQTGYLYHYAFAMLLGVAAIVTWFSLGGGH
jgi:NADH-quinone oxidoreductase subunit L